MMKAEDLKNSVLQMAMQGKLVLQDPNDEPATVLLENIKQEKEQLIKDKKIKRNKNESTIWKEKGQWYEKVGNDRNIKNINDEIDFDIPPTWCYCRIQDILLKLTDGAHKTPKYTETGIPFLSVKDMSSGKLNFSDTKFISEKTHNELYQRCNPKRGDILLTKVGTTGIPVIVNTDKKFSLFVSVALLKFNSNLINRNFFKLLINSPLVQKQCKEKTKGVGNKNWVLRDINSTLIILPPLNEQKRIVEKLEQILPQIEQYAKYEEQLTKLNEEFPEKLKKSILQQAIQGKLVPQNPNDEPATILLEKIKQEKEQLIKDKKIKRNKNESTIYKKDGHWYEVIDKFNEVKCIDDEIPFEIPESWIWCRLNSLGEIVGGGTPKTSIKEYWENGDIPWLTPADMKYVKNKHVERGQRNITKEGLKHSSTRLLPKDSIVFSSRAPIGYIAITKNSLCTNQGFKSINLFKKNLKDYLYYALINQTDEIISRASGTTFKEISGSKFGETLIPLPPINEQIEIVMEIEELFHYFE